MRSFRLLLPLAVLLMLVSASFAEGPPNYRYIPIEHFDTLVIFYAAGSDARINNQSQVIFGGPLVLRESGYELFRDSFPAAIWQDGYFTPIHDAHDYEASGGWDHLNNLGQTAGGALLLPERRHLHPFVGSAGGITELGLLPKTHPPDTTWGPCVYGRGTDINDLGQIVGRMSEGDNFYLNLFDYVVIWEGGAATKVPHVDGLSDTEVEYLFDIVINNAGQVAGTNTYQDARAFFGSAGGLTSIPHGNDSIQMSEVNAMSETGWVVGMIRGNLINPFTGLRVQNQRHGFVSYQGGTLTDLHDLDSASWQGWSNAYDVNADGHIVSVTAPGGGWLYWRNDTSWTRYNIGNLVTEGDNIPSGIGAAIAINDNNVILGYVSVAGSQRPFLLVPIEPPTTQFCVNSTGDEGDATPGDGTCSTGETDFFGNPVCTFRAAIEEANATAGRDTICFDIPGVPTIYPQGNLPTITDEVYIDGSSQPGSDTVEVYGFLTMSKGLTVSATNSEIRKINIVSLAGPGIHVLNADAVQIYGCKIATDFIDTLNFSSSGEYHGIHLENANSCIVGDTTGGDGNQLSNNGGAGVFVESGSGNRIQGNVFYDNDGLGIDLAPLGLNAIDSLDGDSGPNTQINAPLMDSLGSDTVTMYGHMLGEPSTEYSIEVYVSDQCDPSGFGEGQAVVSRIFVTTNNDGAANFSIANSGFWQIGQSITVTATAGESTSEFSNCGPYPARIKIVDVAGQPISNSDVLIEIYEPGDKTVIEGREYNLVSSKTVTTDDLGEIIAEELAGFQPDTRIRISRTSTTGQNRMNIRGISVDNMFVLNGKYVQPNTVADALDGVVVLNRISFVVDYSVVHRGNFDASYQSEMTEILSGGAKLFAQNTNGLVRVGEFNVYDYESAPPGLNSIEFVQKNDAHRSLFSQTVSLSQYDMIASNPGLAPSEIYDESAQFSNIAVPPEPLLTREAARAYVAMMNMRGSGNVGSFNIPNDSDVPVACDDAVPYFGVPFSWYRGMSHNYQWDRPDVPSSNISIYTSADVVADPTFMRSLNWSINCEAEWSSYLRGVNEVLAADASFQDDLTSYIHAQPYDLSGRSVNFAGIYGGLQPTVNYDTPLDGDKPRVSLQWQLPGSFPAVNVRVFKEEGEGNITDLGRTNGLGLAQARSVAVGDLVHVYDFGIGAPGPLNYYFGKHEFTQEDVDSGHVESILDELGNSDDLAMQILVQGAFNSVSNKNVLRLIDPQSDGVFDVVGNKVTLISEVQNPIEMILSDISASIKESEHSFGGHNFDATFEYTPVGAGMETFMIPVGLTRITDVTAVGGGGAVRKVTSRDGNMMYLQQSINFEKAPDDEIWIINSPFPIDRPGLTNDAVQMTDAYHMYSTTEDTTSGIVFIQYTQTDFDALGLSYLDEGKMKIYGRIDYTDTWAEIPSTSDTVANTVSAVVRPGIFLIGVLENLATSAGSDDPSELPSRLRLSQNYPNPFNPTTIISYSLPVRSRVALEVFNVLGQRVRTLVDQDQPAGTYEVTWDGSGESGKPVATGVYLYRLRTKDTQVSKKMLLIR